MTITWTPEKTVADGPAGMVAAQHVTAAQAGAAVLDAGGNAVDAAVTSALVLTVVEPWLSGIGGGGFLVRCDGGTGAVQALDFNMVSPAGLDPAAYPLEAGRDGDWFDWPAVVDNRNLIGPLSICVPGAVAGLAEALCAHGTITWAEALAPAIAEAEAGFRVDWFAELCLAIDAPNLATDPGSAALYLPGGLPPRLPEGRDALRLALPAKAATLRRLATAGPGDFYTGQVAAALLADLAARGAPLTAADFAGYAPEWVEPLRVAYRDAVFHAMPGLSGGPAFAATMARLAADGAMTGPAPGAAHYAAFARAVRAAYAERLTHAGHAARAGIDAGCTSHVSVVDGDGTAVALTNTLLSRFGSKVTSPATGVLMNNGVMWFDPRPGQPNCIAPAVKPLANMCPMVAELPCRAVMAMGAAGGRQIMPTMAQIASFMVDFGMDAGKALRQPRIDASGPTVRVDARAPDGAAGHIARDQDVEVVEDTLYPVQFAIPSVALRHPRGPAQGMVHPNHPWAAAVAGGRA